ncbi:Imm6 family immunity protein [Rummeliibacillus sp. G93]|uniref:Imm6 family immunity protein n=1 Tax=Rummeliibacillus TaxID=648802 RepID=UPI00201BE1D2|nr:Imm6 family immunity protein [Rummeliibacillus sp. G93]UQW96919.1 Imm6 family immunity protein [Rummeliibacillus sp. G93]
MLEKFVKLEADKQVAFLLGLSETIVDLLNTSPAYKDISKALEVCWGWLENKEYSGDDIYFLLDDGTEFTGLFMQMQDEDNALKGLVWGCIVDAISFTNWRAYQFDNEEYLPAPIENVDESILQQFLDGFYEIKTINIRVVQEFINYLKDSNTSLKKVDILKFFEKQQ